MISLLGGDDGCIGGQREVDARVRDQIRLELGQIDVEGAVETQRCRDR